MAIASNSLQAEDLLSAPADLPIPLSTLLGEPVFANPDPLAGLGLADPIVSCPSTTLMDALDVVIANYSSQLAGSSAFSVLPAAPSDLVLASTDQLTGLTPSDSPVGLGLLDANLPPLLATAFASDGFWPTGSRHPNRFPSLKISPSALISPPCSQGPMASKASPWCRWRLGIHPIGSSLTNGSPMPPWPSGW